MSKDKVDISQEWMKQAALRRGEPQEVTPASAAVEQLAAQGREVMNSQKPTAYQAAKQAATADAVPVMGFGAQSSTANQGSTAGQAAAANQGPVVGQVPAPGQTPTIKVEKSNQGNAASRATKVDVAEDKQMPLVFDFALLMFLWIIVLNVGFLAIYKTFTFALVLINSDEISWMSEFIANVNSYFSTAQRFVGLGAIFLALALTFWKLRYRILKMPMPQKSLTTHDAPPMNSAPEILERIVEYLEVGLRLLGIVMTTMITLDILGILTKSPESKAPTLMLIAICVGVPLVILLTVIISSLKRKNSVTPEVK